VSSHHPSEPADGVGGVTDGGRRVIWQRPDRAAKGPAPALTREQIAAAAVAVADAGGVEAVSMRRIATDLGIGPASLYRYVDNKDELFDLMADWVEGEDGAPPTLEGDWRKDASAAALRTRAVFLKHPWLTSVTAARSAFGPNSLAWTEYRLAAFDALDLDVDDRLVASEIITSFVRGFVTREMAEQQSLLRLGLDPQSRAAMMAPYMDQLVRSGRYPRLSAVVRDAQLPHHATREALFHIALTRILDGYQANRGCQRRSPPANSWEA
jgi:AcrR family transcriptional regulator